MTEDRDENLKIKEESPQTENSGNTFAPIVYPEPNQEAKKSRKIGLGAIVVLLAVGKLLVFPILRVTGAELKHRSGHGWDEAHDDFQKHYETTLRQADQIFPIKYAGDVAKCHADAYVSWLNKTGCRGYRIDLLTSATEHQQQLSECLSKAGDEDFSKQSQLSCIKQLVPNTWQAFEGVYAAGFLAALQQNKENVGHEELNPVVANCVAHQYVEKLEAFTTKRDLKCGPMNIEASDLVAMLVDNPCSIEVKSYVDESLSGDWVSCQKNAPKMAH